MEKTQVELIAELTGQIAYLKDFIIRWDASEDNPNTTAEGQSALCDEYNKFIKDNSFIPMSADELLCELEASLGCVIDGQY
jgi:hypothetical protein